MINYEEPKTQDLWLSQFALIVVRRPDAGVQADAAVDAVREPQLHAGAHYIANTTGTP